MGSPEIGEIKTTTGNGGRGAKRDLEPPRAGRSWGNSLRIPI